MNLLRNTHKMDLHKMMLVFFYIYLSFLSFVFTQTVLVPTENKSDNVPSVTQTVYGFLDFTTTIGNTLMVFSPQSASTTSEKPTVQDTVTVINEKPRTESGNSVTEIKPSKTATSSQTSQLDNKVESKNVGKNETSSDKNDKSKDAENKKPTTKAAAVLKSTTHSHGTPSESKTNAKNKTEKSSNKVTPKSLTQNSTTSATTKPVTKSDKPKSTPKANTVGKTDAVTESNSSPQLISTKKFNKEAEKTKPTSKPETTTKANVTPKAHKPEIKSNKLLTSNQTSNVTPKPNAKSTTKSDKPKSTTKTTTKSESVSVSEPPKTQGPEKVNSSVIIASKIEIREGSTSVQKVSKKQEIEPSTVDQSLPSSVQIKNTDQSKSSQSSSPTTTAAAAASSSASSESEEQTKTTEAKEENTSVTDEPAVISSSGVLAPEYDFLSRQPSEVVDETYKVIDLKSNTANGKHQKQKNTYRGTTPPAGVYEETRPLGLITSLSDSIIEDGLTTVYETNVMSAVISGKPAQVLQFNSHVQNQKKIKPSPSSSARILKTAAPTTLKSNRVPNLDPTPVNAYEDESSSLFLEPYNVDQSSIKASRKPSVGGNSFSKNKYSSNKNKFKEDYREDYSTTSSEDEDTLDTDYTLASANPTSPSYSRSTSSSKKTTTKNKSNQNERPFKFQNNRFNRPTTPELATVSVFSESKASAVTPSYSAGNRRFTPSGRRSTAKPATTSSETERGYTNKRNSFKSKIGPSNVEYNNLSPASSTSKFKLSRPSGRWHYKTSPKPRVTIRRQDENLDNVTVSPIPQFTPDIQLETDQELSGSGIFPALQHEDNSIVHDVTPSLAVETLRVEISTPADFKDVYYEIATIKSPYSFQIGTVKNTRFITVTSTFEKSLVQPTESPTARSEPLSENILASTHNAYDKEPPLDSSIATLPPIGLAGDAETPPLETMTESFSTTQLMLKTHILPVVRGGSDTTRYTLVQSYHVTRLVTATKTLPPMEVYQFVPTKALNEFNTRLDEAGSEVHLELEFGDNNEQDDEARPNVSKALLSDLDLTNIGSDFDITDVDKNKILEQHLRAKKAHKLTTSSTPAPPKPHALENPTTPSLSPEQLQQLALLRLFNPNAAALSNVVTSSKPIIKIETAYETHILPIFNGGSTFFTTISRPTATVTKTEFEYVTNTLPMLQPSAFNPLLPQPSFQIATTPIVTQTMLTETDSKVLKLTFGAKTSYTTLYSTKVTPTILTTYLTNSVPIQPTAATFPGFFNPAPYGYNAPFPFVG